MSDPTLVQALSGKRFGLVLSAGYFGFFGHAGLLVALEGAGLSPAAYAGTSAGALVAAMGASGLPAGRVTELLTRLRRGDFWDPAPLSALVDLARGRGVTGLLAGMRFRRLLDESLPVRRIEETRVPLVIVTTDVTHGRARVEVQGSLSEAIQASCAYPGMFRTVRSGDAELWDGGLVDKAPLLALAERVPLDAILLHHLPSRSLERAQGSGYFAAMARSMAGLRKDHLELQARLLEARGMPVYALEPDLPAPSPRRLHVGKEALVEATRQAARALEAPAGDHRRWR